MSGLVSFQSSRNSRYATCLAPVSRQHMSAACLQTCQSRQRGIHCNAAAAQEFLKLRG